MVRDKKKIWTEEEAPRQLEVRAAGRSSVSIGNALKRSGEAVNGRMTRDALRPPILGRATGHVNDGKCGV